MDDKRTGSGGRPPRAGMPAPKPLSDAQKQTVKDLLKKHDTKKITADNAKAFIEASDKAGIRGPAVREAVELVGLDPEKFRALMPQPPHDGKMPSPPPGGRMPPPPGRKERD
jgi:transposase